MSRTVVPLTAITSARPASSAASGLALGAARPAAPGACRGAACTPSTGPGDVPAAVWQRIQDHPCYSDDAHHYFARMHVAVAPGCNIQCHYCNRKYDCANESRPGVVSERLTPDDAVRKVRAVSARMPELSVVGIAGPGDALANHRATFATFRRLRAEMPDLRLCLSTNGLALPDHVETIRALGIDHVTVTMNATDPDIGARIYPWIYWNGKRRHGIEAASILRDRQLEGIAALAAAGVLVKINSVLIPGINDDHLPAVNAAVRAAGAFLHNIMPLISDPAHGTHFGRSGQRGPTPAELKTVQDRLAGDARLMRHCRQCRADAVGLLGEDRNQDFTLAKLDDSALADDGGEARRTYRAVIARERADRRTQAGSAERHLEGLALAQPVLIAICSKGGGRVNQHFGHASEFQVYEAGRDGIRLIGHRRIERYCRGGDGDEDALETVIAALDGIDAVLCAKVGRCPRERLAAAGITVSDAFAFAYIEAAIAGHLLQRAQAHRRAADWCA